MSETITEEVSTVTAPEIKRRPKKEGEKIIEKRPRAPRKTLAPADELASFRAWLVSLEVGVTPTVHVNGPLFTSCVLTVDFGTPLQGIKLTPEQLNELNIRIRNATKVIVNTDAKVNIMNDHNSGVFWTSVA